MKLVAYLQVNGIKQRDFAAALGVAQGQVSDWCSGRKIPSKENMLKIVAYTKGAVMPNDFYDLPSAVDNAAYLNIATCAATYSNQPNNESEGA